MGQSGGAGSLECGNGVVCSTIREQRPPSPSSDSIGDAANPAEAEIKRLVAGETLRRERVSAILYQNEGIQAVSVRASLCFFLPLFSLLPSSGLFGFKDIF